MAKRKFYIKIIFPINKVTCKQNDCEIYLNILSGICGCMMIRPGAGAEYIPTSIGENTSGRAEYCQYKM